MSRLSDAGPCAVAADGRGQHGRRPASALHNLKPPISDSAVQQWSVMSARIAAGAAASEVYQRQPRQQQRLAASLNQIHDKAIADGTHVERTRALVDSEIAAMGGFGLTQLDARMAKRWAAIEERSKL
eukprot:COSAG01_NODE_31215_length_601_cov_1.611554_2_plen_127_part_01